jgi:hypothetical protein
VPGRTGIGPDRRKNTVAKYIYIFISPLGSKHIKYMQ